MMYVQFTPSHTVGKVPGDGAFCDNHAWIFIAAEPLSSAAG